MWHDGYVYVADLVRGVEILGFRGRAGMKAPKGSFTNTRAHALKMDPAYGGVCPLLPLPAALKPVT